MTTNSKTGQDPIAEAITTLVGYPRQVVVFPALRSQSAPRCYVLLGFDSLGDFRAVRLDTADNLKAAERLRAHVLLELAQHQATVHVTDSELGAARMCEMIWPCERTTKLRRAVQAELVA